jgi:hypothetical protein
MDRIKASAFEDTNRMFVPPDRFDLRVTESGSPEYWAEQAMTRLRPVFDSKKPTALFIGRYQPFHEGHRALIIEGLKRVGQACIAVRNTRGIDDKNPFDFEYVRARIEHGLREFVGRFIVVPLPNVTNIFTAATSATPSNASSSTPRPRGCRPLSCERARSRASSDSAWLFCGSGWVPSAQLLPRPTPRAKRLTPGKPPPNNDAGYATRGYIRVGNITRRSADGCNEPIA